MNDRMLSFLPWDSSHHRPVRLAAAGFIYEGMLHNKYEKGYGSTDTEVLNAGHTQETVDDQEYHKLIFGGDFCTWNIIFVLKSRQHDWNFLL